MLFLGIIGSGLIATTAMTLFLALVHRNHLANGDMARALGSLITKKEEGSLGLGLVIHYAAGCFFAVLYHSLVKFAPVDAGPYSVIFICLAAGFFHGLVMSMFLSILVAEHHPLERFRKAGPDVVIAHLAAHLVYGLTLGTSFYFLIG
ncbi:MAG: hypothetical protein EA369_09835 [Bradymonadales bacterium]|nr:MAG: hypothetical protein EA369_09835 [Bradymonadales bacterium]